MWRPRKKKSKIEALYLTHYNLMAQTARRILKKEEWAEDAVHDTTLKLIDHLDRIDEIDSDKTRAFIFTVTKNTALNILKKERLVAAEELDTLIYKLKAPDDITEQAYVKELLEQILALPKEMQEPLILSAYYGMNSKQIAHVLGITDQLVRKRISRARHYLDREMGVLCHED